MKPPLLELRDVTVLRGSRRVLDNASLRIERDERVAILGPNGCGKSTLLKLLTRELYPVAAPGSFVRIHGHERWNVTELRRTLGIVANDLSDALGGSTVIGAVLSGFFASLGVARNHTITPAMIRSAEEALARLGIASLADRSFDELSSGQARRVLIARALVNEPETLVFDEPGTALDMRARHDLYETVRDLTRRGRGLILVTHDLAEIAPEVDRVIFMRAGRFIADGPAAEMLVPERLGALFEIPLDACGSCGTVAFAHARLEV